MNKADRFQNTFWTVCKQYLCSLYPRVIGALIVFKITVPIIVLAIVLIGLWQIYQDVNDEMLRVDGVIRSKVGVVKKDIHQLYKDIQNVSQEIKRVKNEMATVGKEINLAIEPIKKSLAAIEEAGNTISDSVEETVNTVTQSKILKILKLKKLDLPAFKILKIPLPNINIDPSLNIDWTAFEGLKAVGYEILDEMETSLNTLMRVWNSGWWILSCVFYVMFLWVLVVLIGMTARAYRHFMTGIELITGRQHDASLAML